MEKVRAISALAAEIPVKPNNSAMSEMARTISARFSRMVFAPLIDLKSIARYFGSATLDMNFSADPALTPCTRRVATGHNGDDGRS